MITMAPSLPQAAIDATYNLLAILTEPTRYREMLDQLVAARDGAFAVERDFDRLKQEQAAFAAEREKFEEQQTASLEAVTARENGVAARNARADGAEQKLVAERQALERDRKAHDAAVAEHAGRLAELDRLRKVLAA